MKVLFQLTDQDAQIIALEKLGRKLTDEELYIVRKGLEFGLESWGEVMSLAIEGAIEIAKDLKQSN